MNSPPVNIVVCSMFAPYQVRTRSIPGMTTILKNMELVCSGYKVAVQQGSYCHAPRNYKKPAPNAVADTPICGRSAIVAYNTMDFKGHLVSC